jgi:hypothetical protein
MIQDVTPLRLAVAFASGWLVVAVVTSFADAFGRGPAGFAGGLPSSGSVSLLMIGVSETGSAAVRAAAAFPLGFAAALAFLLFYAWPRSLRFGIRMPLALSLWFASAAAVAFVSPDDLPVSLVLSGVVDASVFVLHRKRGIKEEGWSHAGFDPLKALWRGTLGGTVVSAVVVVSAVAGPGAGGVFAAAPAIWSSSLYVSDRSQGLQFSRSLTGAFLRTGIFTVIPYAVAAWYLFQAFGVWWGTLLSYAAISPLAWVAWKLANRD